MAETRVGTGYLTFTDLKLKFCTHSKTVFTALTSVFGFPESELSSINSKCHLQCILS